MNAFILFANLISSTIEVHSNGEDELVIEGKKENGYQHFKSTFKQNAITSATKFLEQSFVFVKNKSRRWSAHICYLYDKDQDHEAMKELLEKTLANTKLMAAEQLWLKNLMKDLK